MFEVFSGGVVDESSAGRLRAGQCAECEAKVGVKESHGAKERGRRRMAFWSNAGSYDCSG
jgi:hypothetical protein